MAPDDASRGRAVQRLQYLYAQLAAQMLNFQDRMPAAHVSRTGNSSDIFGTTGDAFAFAPVTAQLHLRGHRLVQNGVSTRTLEGLPVTLAACAVVSSVLVREEKELLPMAPGSIAARMSLLAGSRLVERVK
ncbi:hypothetical protein B0T24DRAFT_674675 [Lasiosphaeria ovina]|uniref:Uncharacterized protein n=1 Tax=Lasiosphaeria ovina TaxID=92902 RepID=A0AAE0NCN9_9PEZI|nr:hypothetical protein B0T24DRAFT_674675 [Lasiosphaeria ovina]